MSSAVFSSSMKRSRQGLFARQGVRQRSRAARSAGPPVDIGTARASQPAGCVVHRPRRNRQAQPGYNCALFSLVPVQTPARRTLRAQVANSLLMYVTAGQKTVCIWFLAHMCRHGRALHRQINAQGACGCSSTRMLPSVWYRSRWSTTGPFEPRTLSSCCWQSHVALPARCPDRPERAVANS